MYREQGRLYIKNKKKLVYGLSWKCKEDFSDYLERFYDEKVNSGIRNEIHVNLKEVLADFCKQNLEYKLLLEHNFRFTPSGERGDTVILKELSRNAWFDKRGRLRITNFSTGF